MVIGHGRTGSTLLSLSLGEHDSIRMYLEIFHDDPKERETSFRAERAYQSGEDAVKFINQAVFFPRHWKQLKAVGFKLFYDHARKDREARKVWIYLEENKGIHIIHLLRRNLLESWISFQTATRTGVWAVMEKTPELNKTVKPYRLDALECQDFFKSIELERERIRSMFASHPYMEVEYERDLCDNFSETMFRIQNFLGVPRQKVKVLTQKQRRLSPSEQISNYSELKKYFSATKYKTFFD